MLRPEKVHEKFCHPEVEHDLIKKFQIALNIISVLMQGFSGVGQSSHPHPLAYTLWQITFYF